MEVPDIVSGTAVHAFPDMVGQGSHGGEVWCLIEPQAILVGKALPFQDLSVQVRQAGPSNQYFHLDLAIHGSPFTDREP
jgi:hypothetical protein